MLPLRCSLASTTPARGPAGPIGVPEVSSGIPSPPRSPPLGTYTTGVAEKNIKPHRGGAAYTITGECERLFCEQLRAVFLGEGNLARQDSLVEGMQYFGYEQQQDQQSHHDTEKPEALGRFDDHDATAVAPVRSISGYSVVDGPATAPLGSVTHWLEAFDYVGGARFRGFVAEKHGCEKAMFIFFDGDVIGRDLKPGLMALLELCSIPNFDAERLVVCIHRSTPQQLMMPLTKDLGWVGFDLLTLEEWTRNDDIVSKEWIFMGMEV